ncbi:MAG TPA: hypothetical protein VH518_21225 [Tepidisphaeraceae bacterium]|jgi:hypothetical protein
MDPNQLMLSLLFGSIGLGFFMYGKKAGRPVPLLTGVALMVVPYFIPSAIALLLVCSVLSVLPWFLRHA